MQRRITWLTGIAAVALIAECALADGVMMPPRPVLLGEATKMVASPKQEALLISDGKTVEVTLRTHFRAGPSELAWVVPVPARPTNIEKADEAVFTQLHMATTPRFFEPAKGKGAFSCGCGSMNRADGLQHVVVEATGTAGIFKYVVLSATRADELTKWLNDNKYYVPPGAERMFKRYVRGGWHWLAMRVRPEAADEPTLAPHPIRYRYRDEKLTYPLAISQLSADLENEIVLYVLAANRCACANWANSTLDDLTGNGRKLSREADSPSMTNYEKLFRTAASEQHGHLFVTEFAGDLDNVGQRPLLKTLTRRDPLKEEMSATYLTRLRAVMTPRAMDRDVVLVQMAEAGDVRNVIYLSRRQAAASYSHTVAAAGGLAILCMGTFFLRRRTALRAAGVFCIALACTVFAMV